MEAIKIEEGYYIPTIEEFHVGFEYEITLSSVGGMYLMDMSTGKSTVISEAKIPIWEKTKVTSTMSDTGEMITVPMGENGNTLTYKDETFPSDHRSLEQIVTLIKSNQIRVKHFDQEDIESLNFKLYKQSNVNHFTFRLACNDETQVHVSFGEPTIVSFSTRSGLETMFFNINNISEFRKLLQQLNIPTNEK